MALIHALMRLKDEELIKSFDFINGKKEKAKVIIANDQEIVVFMAEDMYVLTRFGIQSAWEYPPVPNFIVYNQWEYVSSLAFDKAKSQGIRMISFVNFSKLLRKIIEA